MPDWKQPKYLSTREQISTLWCIHTVEYCWPYIDLGRTLKCDSAMEYNNEYKGIVNLLRTSHQVVNLQRCKHAFYQCQEWLQLSLHLLRMRILLLYHLALPLPPTVSNSSCLFTRCQLLYASCCTVLFKILYRKIKNIFFIFVCLFLIYYLKSIINLLQYNTV